MTFFLDPQNCHAIYAKEYLQSFPNRGQSIAYQELNLEFYELTDCLCCDQRQVIAPIHNKVIPCTFKESGPYLSSIESLAKQAFAILSQKPTIYEVEEAAPFSPAGAANLWHWTTESLPKLLALEELGYQGQYIVPIHAQVVQESLAMHGIAKERLLDSRQVWRVKKLMLPAQLSGFIFPENQALVAFTRDKILAAAGGRLPGSKNVYIKRIGRRKILNEAQLLELLKPYNFEIMVPEDLSLKAQWQYMSNAKCAIMAHGANNTLTFTQPEKSIFIEFFSNRYINYSCMHSIRLLKQHYLPLVEELDISWYPDQKTSVFEHLSGGIPADINVQLIHLKLHLEILLDQTN